MTPRKPKTPPPPQYLITTPLRDGTCRHCHTTAWFGYCNGIAIVIDPTRINRQAELGVTLAGIPTYEVPVGTRRPSRRTRWNIPRWPTYGFVHPAHQCGAIWPDTCRDTRPDMPWLDPDTYTRINPDQCPF